MELTDTDETQTAVAQALALLQGFLDAAELDTRAAVESHEGELLTLAITGPDSSLLVGVQGVSLNALQYLMQLVMNKNREVRLRVTLDADRYRMRRNQTLVKFAHELAAQVMETGEEAVTEALNPMDRRIIHTALAGDPAIQTYSEGEEPNRYVVIAVRPEPEADAPKA